MIFGFVSNHLRTVYNNDNRIVEYVILQFFMIGTIQLVALLFIINFAHLQVSPSHWGFTFGRGLKINLIIAAVTSIPLLGASGIGFSIQDFFLPFRIVGATVEELVFRVLLICMLISKFGQGKGRVFLAILISAILFTIVHIPSKGQTMLVGIFASSIIMGYIYYRTRSIFFLVFSHVVCNTAATSGIIGGLVAVGMYILLAHVGQKMNTRDKLRAQSSFEPPI